MAASQNIVGPAVRKIRYQRGWTQAILTARCARVGWDVHQSTIGKIEAQYRGVSDREIVFIAQALEVRVQDLFPVDARIRKGK
jgi:transcriptional regulator with XRE-family HTH domain